MDKLILINYAIYYTFTVILTKNLLSRSTKTDKEPAEAPLAHDASHPMGNAPRFRLAKSQSFRPIPA